MAAAAAGAGLAEKGQDKEIDKDKMPAQYRPYLHTDELVGHTYEDFDVKSKEYRVFRTSEYSWREHGYASSHFPRRCCGFVPSQRIA